MPHGYSHTSSTASAQNRTNAQGQVAPPGFHYMPDGTLMSDAVHTELYGSKVIQSFILDVSDIGAAGENRVFTINATNNSEFRLEIKNSSGLYYNFNTKAFQTAATRLSDKTNGGSYEVMVLFPSSASDEQYDVYLWAGDGVQHADYNEVRFGDGSIDINSSTGSSSLLLQKVIYQYEDVTLTLSPYSPGGAVGIGSPVSNTIVVSRGKTSRKMPFEISLTSPLATKSYQITKQPTHKDVVAFIEPVIGSAPINLPGENIYPTKTASGLTGAVMSSTATVTMADSIGDLGLKIGDKVIQATGPFFANIVTVVAITGGGLSANQFTASEAVSVGNGVRLDFYNRMNYSWPIDNYANIIRPGMFVVPTSDGLIPKDTVIAEYKDSTIELEGTESEKEIIKSLIPAVRTMANRPTVVKGLVTVQAGNIVFNKQLALELEGDTLKVGGYGESAIFDLYGYRVRFSDMTIALTPITTTTTSAVSNSTSVPVASRNGILDSISSVSGIGIDPSVANPTVSSGAGTVSGAGTIVLSAAQTLEDGITLTFAGAGQKATISGDIEILKAGTANQALRFDVDKLITYT
tara:strand:- start:2307 stop:4040 length:1734 start_codon:yes stop_codon:yes gene_type:complete